MRVRRSKPSGPVPTQRAMLTLSMTFALVAAELPLPAWLQPEPRPSLSIQVPRDASGTRLRLGLAGIGYGLLAIACGLLTVGLASKSQPARIAGWITTGTGGGLLALGTVLFATSPVPAQEAR